MSPQSILESFRWIKEQPPERLEGFFVGVILVLGILFGTRKWILKFLRSAEAKKAARLEKEVEKLEVSLRRLEEIEKVVNNLPRQLWFARPLPPDCPQFVPITGKRPRIISIFNLKGGVGKTTLALNLAHAISRKRPGQRILLIDADWQGSLTGLAVRGEPEYDTLVQARQLLNRVFEEDALPSNPYEYLHSPTNIPNCWLLGADGTLGDLEDWLLVRWCALQLKRDPRFVLRELLHSGAIASLFDVVIIDCPPRLTAASVAALAASDRLVIPVIPDSVSLDAATILLEQLATHARQNVAHNLNVAGILVNKVKGTGLTKSQQNQMEVYRGNWDEAWGTSVTVWDKDGQHVPMSTQTVTAAFTDPFDKLALALVPPKS